MRCPCPSATWHRSLALAECGGVTLTLMVEEDGSTVTRVRWGDADFGGNADESRDGAIRPWNIPALRSLGHLRQRPGRPPTRFLLITPAAAAGPSCRPSTGFIAMILMEEEWVPGD